MRKQKIQLTDQQLIAAFIASEDFALMDPLAPEVRNLLEGLMNVRNLHSGYHFKLVLSR